MFRLYAWSHLTKKGVMVRPKKYCLIDPEKLDVDFIYGKERINKKIKGKHSAEKYSEFRQKKIMDYFKKHAIDYRQEHKDNHRKDHRK